jgi:hypothetical protein
MKTLIKLLVAAAIIHAVVRSGASAATYWELKDTAHQMLVFGGGASPEQLHESILAKAAELSVPLAPENVFVRREGVRTTAEGSYTDRVEFLPRYRYPITYTFKVEALSISAQSN